MMQRKELIGTNARAIDKTSGRTFQGTIVDESYHTICIDDVCLLKKNITLTIGQDEFDGTSIEMRPHDRTKARFKRIRKTRL